MNKYAKRWLEELRSGKHKQTKGVLQRTRRVRGEEVVSRCCLGVACEIYRQETGIGEWSKSTAERCDLFALPGDAHQVDLPPEVRKFFGIKKAVGAEVLLPKTVKINAKGMFQGNPYCLSGVNDSGVPFPKIADIIEENADKIFEKEEA